MRKYIDNVEVIENFNSDETKWWDVQYKGRYVGYIEEEPDTYVFESGVTGMTWDTLGNDEDDFWDAVDMLIDICLESEERQ